MRYWLTLSMGAIAFLLTSCERSETKRIDEQREAYPAQTPEEQNRVNADRYRLQNQNRVRNGNELPPPGTNTNRMRQGQ